MGVGVCVVGEASEKTTSQLQELNQDGCDRLMGAVRWGPPSAQPFRALLLPCILSWFNSGEAEKLCDLGALFHLSRPQSPKVYEDVGLVQSSDTELQPFSVLGRGRNVGLELAGP